MYNGSMVTFRDIFNGLRKLEIDRSRPVIAHASLSSFGEVNGGAETVLGALLGAFNILVMPTFTYKTMITPEIGPADNALVYGSGGDANRMAEFFQPDMPADRLMGIIPETLRRGANAQRSSHPIFSFAGVNAAAILETQTLAEPLAPIGALQEAQGWVLLIGVDHTVNTTIHYAERLAGRRQFTRWALTAKGIVECPGFPGDSAGFQAVSLRLEGSIRKVQVGTSVIQALPLASLVSVVRNWIAKDPLALLCARPDCERCQATRAAALAGAQK